MKKIIIFFLIFSSILVSAQNDSVRTQKLNEIELYPFPTRGELENILLADFDIEFSEISHSDINIEFSNIEDLNWIKNIAKENGVILLGEDHHHKYITHFRNRLFFAINTFDYYPLIVFEGQYSYTGYINYYLSIEDDNESEIFFNEELHPMISYQEDYEFLNHIRRWNKINPQKLIKVGYSDVEHDFRTTINRILIPYFHGFDPGSLKDIQIEFVVLDELISLFRQQLEKAKSYNYIGKYPFITPEYISTVIDNIEALFYAEFHSFDYYRQAAIIRNLTDENFLGKLWKNQKVFIHGGAWHTASKLSNPKIGGYIREGTYLSNVYEPTMNKVYSIRARGLAKSLDEMYDIDIDSCVYTGETYNYYLSRLQKAYKNKLINPNDFLFIRHKPNSLDSLIIKKNYSSNSNILKLDYISNKDIRSRIFMPKTNYYTEYKWTYYDIDWFDLNIVFIKSPIQVARNRNEK